MSKLLREQSSAASLDTGATETVARLEDQAELHDEKHQPDIKNGGQIGMPLDKFTNEAYAGLAAGKEEVPVGNAAGWYDAFEPQRQQLFNKMAG
ncbi:MAG: hypothetical protein Q9197_002120 [Variospora fuerteventurae]